jgi:hypothetical protein
LFAGPGGLDHLIVSAVAFFEIASAKLDRGVIDDLGLLVRDKVSVAAV